MKESASRTPVFIQLAVVFAIGIVGAILEY
jgi:hypothetical protein